ncbi:MAG TPA: hypothetical protein ENI08_00780 [Candidatus Dependentiae bacterium]|nr:hypothetical protein [Candidatus Dependentiae bacterium]
MPQQKVEGQKCEFCDGLIIKSPKTGKLFCEKKCWLNGGGQGSGTTSTKSSGGYGKKTMADFKIMILSYAKDYCIGAKLDRNEIFKIADQMIKWFKGEPKKAPPTEQSVFESPIDDTDDIPI